LTAGQTAATASCRLCGGAASSRYVAREMMFGTRDEFEYAQCDRCGALQRSRTALALTPYYPASYYAFAPSGPGRIRAGARALRNWLALSPSSPVRGVMQRIRPPISTPWLRVMNPPKDARILDVGCGKGQLLRELAEAGYASLTGVDPFLPDVVETPASVRMHRSPLEAVSGEFDVIMFHHSLEHIEDQRSTMQAVGRLLSAGGWCLIRIPTVSSYAWEHYREHWFQIDAPRHLVLHSLESIRQLGESAGLDPDRVDFDSNELQILWSERYKRGIAMSDGAAPFSRAETRAARQLARRLNLERRGDQIAVYFRKHPPGARRGADPP
jgi:SAM-dependent methyltransferase